MKKLLLLVTTLIIGGCSNLELFNFSKEKSIKAEYERLSLRFDMLVDGEIKERDRGKLEEDFIKYRNRINKSGGENVKFNNFLRKYVNKSDIKIQYLKDLKD